MLDLADKAWRTHKILKKLVSELKRHVDTEEVLTLREIRNYAMHRDGMVRGPVQLREETLDDVRGGRGRRVRLEDFELPALWVLARDNAHLHSRIAPLSDFHSAEIAVISFSSILERILSSSAKMVRVSQAVVPPGEGHWLKGEPGYAQYSSFKRSWNEAGFDRLCGFAEEAT